MPPSTHPVGNRALIERFGAHVAHLLNAGDGAVVEVKPFALYLRVIALLSGKGRKGPEYRDGLLGFWLAGADRSSEQLAQAYLDGVLDRRLMLARGNEQHIAHELFALMCQRGVADGWEASKLARAKSLPTLLEATAPAPLDFVSVALRLAKIDKGLSRGNPALATAEAKGPLLLRAGQGQAEVADELSAWKAIITSPGRQRQLAEGEAFHELWSLVIKAFETANVHYGTLLRLGLPPFDWVEALSINTARAVSRFLTACGELSDDQRDAVETWRQVWPSRKVPGYSSADEFWSSELGNALRTSQVTRFKGGVPPDDFADPTGAGANDKLLEAMSFSGLLEQARNEAAITEFDIWLLSKLHFGAKISELSSESTVQSAMHSGGSDLDDYIEQLREALLRWSQGRRQRDGGNDEDDALDD